MSIRNCGELGPNLQKIIKRLLQNDDLIKLVYYNNEDPLSQPSLSDTEKNEKIFDVLIKSKPHYSNDNQEHCGIVVYIKRGATIGSNQEFRNITIYVDIFVPLSMWYIKDANLRPFAIMGEIQSSLNDKVINGLGKITGGDFDLSFITDDVCCYQQHYEITEYV